MIESANSHVPVSAFASPARSPASLSTRLIATASIAANSGRMSFPPALSLGTGRIAPTPCRTGDRRGASVTGRLDDVIGDTVPNRGSPLKES